MKKISIIASLLALLAGTASCDKQQEAGQEAGLSGNLTVSFSAESRTRASDLATTAGETALNTVDVFIFRTHPDGGAATLEARHRATSSELSAKVIRLEVIPGRKRVYVVANLPSLSDTEVASEEDLQALWSDFTDNRPGSFVMVGTSGGDVDLSEGTGNKVSVELRRLAARVKVERIEASLPEATEGTSSLLIRRVYLTYVPKRIPLVNGDVEDCFGTPERKTVGEKTYDDYYGYPVPVPGDDRLGSSPDGFYNPGVLVGDREVRIWGDAAALTLATPGAVLYGRGDTPAHAWVPEGGLYLYTYPNPSKLIEQEGVYDYTTKLVVEAEMDGELCWYPIPVAYTQPNYAYTVNSIRITRRGSDDPNLPIYTSAVTVSMTVTDWTTGEFIGSYNHLDGDNGFIM